MVITITRQPCSASNSFLSYRAKSRRTIFIICQSCYWCTSCFKAEENFSKCPQCAHKCMDRLPLSIKVFDEV